VAPSRKACLNGDVMPDRHPAVPVTPDELALQARAVMDAGATAVHVHPRGADGRETLAWDDIAAAVVAIRTACPGLPVGVSTRAEICPDPLERLALVSAWRGPGDGGPDFASVNWHEDRATDVADALAARGIGVEAGLFTPDAARAFAAGPWPSRVVRALAEALPGISPGADGVAAAGAILAGLGTLTGSLEVVVHGEREWAWPVLAWAREAGYGVRAGFEDMLAGPGGEPVTGNADLFAWW
jgi:uncharacterized protein (DUF849 family)